MGLTEGSEVHACVPGVCSWFLQLLSGTTSTHVTVSRMSLIRANLLPYHSQKMEESAPRRGRVTFGWLVGLSQVLGLVSVVLTGVWMGHYKGGFAWDGSAQQFNVHPLCMVLGLVFLQGDGKSTKKNQQSLFYDCVPSSFFPNAFGAAGVTWRKKNSKKPSWSFIQLQPDRLPASMYLTC